MGARESLQRLADKKSQEIEQLESQIQMARVYLQAIQDSIKALPREAQASGNGNEIPVLRAGTLLAKAREAIVKNGKPMYIGDILASIGLENTKATRVSLVGSLGVYVRKKVIFTRPGPNIFGIVGMEMPSANGSEVELPDEFGEVTEGV
jgi:hypothetical protein